MDDSIDATLDNRVYGVRVYNAVEHDVQSQKPVEWEESDEYNFNHPRRGVALIVCNEQFEGADKRTGADLDAEHFENVFRKLGFQDIRIKFDMTGEDMKDWFTAVSNEDHSDSDCLAVAITSHGDQEFAVHHARYNVLECKDVILGKTGTIHTEELVSSFSDVHCPTLAGKPKIFLLQACRGKTFDEGVTVTDTDVVDALIEPEYTISPAPCYKDFCIVYASPPGHYAFRRPTEGSWFVKALWDTVKGVDPGTVNFHKLLTKAINKVAMDYQSNSINNPDINEKKQAGCVYSMLTKDVFFTPKPEPEEPL